MSDKYLPNEIPKRFELILYTNYCYNSEYDWNMGKVVHATHDMSGDQYICIAQTKVIVNVPEQKKDIRKMVLEALQTEKEKQMAEHHKRMFELQEKIDSLLQLTHQPLKGEIIDETANEIPY